MSATVVNNYQNNGLQSPIVLTGAPAGGIALTLNPEDTGTLVVINAVQTIAGTIHIPLAVNCPGCRFTIAYSPAAAIAFPVVITAPGVGAATAFSASMMGAAAVVSSAAGGAASMTIAAVATGSVGIELLSDGTHWGAVSHSNTAVGVSSP
jgi:hypothetical protein